jgi:hypothetical protein
MTKKSLVGFTPGLAIFASICVVKRPLGTNDVFYFYMHEFLYVKRLVKKAR